MDFDDGTRLEIYDETHVWYDSDGEVLERFPVVPVVHYHSGKKTTVEAFEEFGRAWAQLVKDAAQVLEPFARHIAERWAQPPANVMERALQARKNRNTGPTRPSAASARRPRRHQ
jgi:hypothetical protein